MKYQLKDRYKLNVKRIILSIVLFSLLTISIGYSYLETMTSFLDSMITTDNLNNCYDVEILGKTMVACLDNKKSEYVTSSSGISFSSNGSNTNGKGLYVRAATKDDENPIFYFRGTVDNNNVIFANHCWKIVRTTDTGGTKLLYNGTTTFDNLPIAKADYNVVSNDTSKPFIFEPSSESWVSNNHTASSSSSITISVKTPGNYVLAYDISSEKTHDKATIYLDGISKGTVSGSDIGTITFNNLTTSNRIMITYSKDSTIDTGRDNVKFNLGIPTGNPGCNNSASLANFTSSAYASTYSFGNVASGNYMYNKYMSFQNKQKPSASNTSATVDFFSPLSTTSYILPVSYKYYYADDYTYADGKFNLTTNVANGGEWSTNYNTLKNGKYSCLSTSTNCTKLYYIYDGTETEIKYVEVPNDGTFNPANVSSMEQLSKSVASLNYYFSKSYTYDGSKYVLTNPAKIGHWLDIYNNMDGEGYYTCNSTTSYSCTTLMYVAYGTRYYIYHIPLTGGQTESSQNVTMYFAKTYTDNGNGTYTLNSPSSVKREDFNNVGSSWYGYYFCANPSQTTCSNIKVLSYSDITTYYYYDNEIWTFGKNVNWNGSTYTLSGDQITKSTSEIAADHRIVRSYHYTCFNNSTSCSNVYYGPGYTSAISSTYNYYTLSGGATVPFDEMFPSDSTINSHDSLAKAKVDSIFQGSSGISSYLSYLEDTPWCNERTLKDKKGLVTTGVGYDWDFKLRSGTTIQLKCDNQLDNFTVSSANGNGALTYPVGLITYSEVLLGSNYLYSSSSYWTMTPSYHLTINYIHSVGSDSIDNNIASASLGIRPMVSLKKGIVISSGNGTRNNPYVIS